MGAEVAPTKSKGKSWFLGFAICVLAFNCFADLIGANLLICFFSDTEVVKQIAASEFFVLCLLTPIGLFLNFILLTITVIRGIMSGSLWGFLCALPWRKPVFIWGIIATLLFYIMCLPVLFSAYMLLILLLVRT